MSATELLSEMGAELGIPALRADEQGCCRLKFDGDRTVEIHEANLFDMNAKNADVMPLAEVEAWFSARRARPAATSGGGGRATGTAAA